VPKIVTATLNGKAKTIKKLASRRLAYITAVIAPARVSEII